MSETGLTRQLLLAAATIAIAACNAPTDEMDDLATKPLSVSTMTFNVENLFDNDDDAGKDDRSFLPIEAKSTNQPALRFRLKVGVTSA